MFKTQTKLQASHCVTRPTVTVYEELITTAEPFLWAIFHTLYVNNVKQKFDHD